VIALTWTKGFDDVIRRITSPAMLLASTGDRNGGSDDSTADTTSGFDDVRSRWMRLVDIRTTSEVGFQSCPAAVKHSRFTE
jgi:hypothetical protein